MLSSKLSRENLALAAAWAFLRRLLYAALLVALVALAAALSVAALPRLFGYGTLQVDGGSMADAYPNGSLVITRWMPAEEAQLGDVIVVQEDSDDGPARPKLHRIVSLDEQGSQILVRTKGDANQTPDPKLYILPDQVRTPAHMLPYLGHVVGFVVTPLGWVLLVALPATLLCVTTLRAIWTGEDEPARKVVPSRDRPNLPPSTTLPLLLCAAFMIGAVGVSAALGLFVDTASVPGNTFTTAASFP